MMKIRLNILGVLLFLCSPISAQMVSLDAAQMEA